VGMSETEASCSVLIDQAKKSTKVFAKQQTPTSAKMMLRLFSKVLMSMRYFMWGKQTHKNKEKMKLNAQSTVSSNQIKSHMIMIIHR
jgi:nicotinamide riboside transporter PnuC